MLESIKKCKFSASVIPLVWHVILKYVIIIIRTIKNKVNEHRYNKIILQ